ncbi:uncharacterized protein LOC130625608 [Hydractinia symbiolongicarpus]|uniref:uncharacterized protein LOC130625608 n=1 Tax=Hydractinia symbiolongicarpus TaxID=13093 RepID=UPI00254ED5CF|nr:uncharacterized protein LOC130625608 [Hydractinia symbiolongicarpus]
MNDKMLLILSLIMFITTVKSLSGLGPTRRTTTKSNGNTILELCRLHPMLCKTKFKNMFTHDNKYAMQLLKKLIEAQKKAKMARDAAGKQNLFNTKRKPLITTVVKSKNVFLLKQNKVLATFDVIAKVRRSLR